MARIEKDEKTGQVDYAVVRWSIEDVTGVSSMTDDEAHDWLYENAKYIEEAVAQRGNEVIEQLLLAEGRLDLEDDDEEDDDDGDGGGA